MKKGSVLKRLYIIAVLAAPLYWLMLTDDGRRFTDTTILKLSGGKTMDIHLKALSSSITEKALQQQLPETPFTCSNNKTPFGNRICQVKLASFNGIPARFAIAYFADDHLQALKIGYQRPYHRQLLDYLFATQGKPGTADHITAPGAPGFYRWHIGGGELVILDEQSLKGQEPALLWKTLQPPRNI